MNKVSVLLLVTLLVRSSVSEVILNGLPVSFSLTGQQTYTPDAGGGTQTGYTINLGYTGSSWIAAELITLSGNTDVLVVTIDDFYSTSTNGQNSGHLVSFKDYFRNASGLQLDKNTASDVSSYAYSQKLSYSLPIVRSLSSNSGEDWAASSMAYSVLKVCFYTSSSSFVAATFANFYSACYNFEIDNLVSTFVGPLIKTFNLNGYQTSIYGYIDGPILSNKVYFYQESPQFTYVQVPAIAIEIGTTAGSFGQDFYVWSPVSSQNGDYFGSDISNITLDNFAFGFQNPALSLAHWNANPATPVSGLSKTALRISFARDIYTYDQYDKTMKSTFLFCLYIFTSGSISGSLSDKSCEMVELSKSYLEMSTSSSGEGWILMSLMVLMIVGWLL